MAKSRWTSPNLISVALMSLGAYWVPWRWLTILMAVMAGSALTHWLREGSDGKG